MSARKISKMIDEEVREPSTPGEYRLASPPKTSSLSVLRKAALRCTACPLYKNATCTVFGDGPGSARVILIGEQPGDQEDREGRAFIGPAGKLLDRALAEAGIDREMTYVTNAVKHFKWEPRGKRRIHKKPSAREIAACRPWLEAEIAAIQPTLLVCLGATAIRSVFGAQLKISEHRGRVTESPLGPALITVHPSSLLRMPDRTEFKQIFGQFREDLSRIKSYLAKEEKRR